MVERISPKQAMARLEEGWTYVDVRSVPEFEQGHPAGAYNVPLMHMGAAGMAPNPEFLSVMQERFPTDARLVLGCRSGARSLRAAEMLEAAGFEHVVDQRAGWDGARDPFGRELEPGWRGEGLASAMEAEPGRSWDALSKGV
ncbi:MAG: rhodanese-like domain-containing protein [Sandaracinaceae bacterium]|nr:MAG: rhodanese-like domain-containing protein [Sandaracinaceae bacterium]HBQ19903.1 rhodanese-like domain-containing protein [Myxococcales bacterium]